LYRVWRQLIVGSWQVKFGGPINYQLSTAFTI
jgi:hypothetical protein